jgi:hypothetical protein
MEPFDRLLDWLEGVVEDLEQQEQQDSGGRCVQEGLQPGRRILQPAQWESKEDGHAGNATEQDGLSRGHDASWRWSVIPSVEILSGRLDFPLPRRGVGGRV